ncbi:MAG: DUF389 domain-containing protein [Selenomonadaceae bacterium]|nr:DUF389 domain-containing protein [Selenomonadaceae bacterium]
MEQFKNFVADLFNLQTDRASLEEISERIHSGGQLKGTNMCILILAIFIASIGLNMNSTAVIIGAMLISPLMGVIMSIGYGMASYDSAYVRESIIKLIFQVALSILASACYFYLSPISTASSELLARTEPTIWDVLIAIFGGLAGIIGSTRAEKGNVIPGVAIATALMPPLCTAGFGLAHHSFKFFFGALYLFFINSFFICLTTFIILKLFKIPVKSYVSEKVFRRQQIYLTILGVLVIIPSLSMAYQSVTKNLEQVQSQVYLAKHFDTNDLQVVSNKVDKQKKIFEVTVVGRPISADEIAILSNDLQEYSQLSDLKLQVIQNNSSLTADELKDLIKTQIESGTDKITNVEDELKKFRERAIIYAPAYHRYEADKTLLNKISAESKVIFPQIVKVEGASIASEDAEGKISYEKFAAIVYVKNALNEEDTKKLRDWLTAAADLEIILTVLPAPQPESPSQEITPEENTEQPAQTEN